MRTNSSDFNITHDANGNMTKCVKPDTWAASYTLTYDAWNRLVTVKDGSTVVASYQYDALNHRVKKVVGSETRTFYFNNQWQCVEEYIGSSCDVRYVWGLRYIDDLVTYRKGSADYYSVADPNWNVVALVNVSGVAQERYTYSSFGKSNIFSGDFSVVRNVSAYNMSRTFTGQTYDAETGLMLYRNRVYHPTLGRFIQRDPIGYDAGDVNIYRYVKNMVITNIDNQGLQIFDPGGNVIIPPSDIYGQMPLPISTSAPSIQCSIKPCLSKCEQLPINAPGIKGRIEFGTNKPREWCVKKCETYEDAFNNWYEKNRDITWTNSLEPCPCKLENRCKDKWSDPGPPIMGYHPGASNCIRSSASAEGHANQCCYDTNGDLITSGSGQGSSDWTYSVWYNGAWVPLFGTHNTQDMTPADWATFLDGGKWGCFSDGYLNVRPQVKSPNCKGVPTPSHK
jgi:RHS repeat-associated protein